MSQGPVISFCFEHNGTDIRVRHYGELCCENWHPDDLCRIGEGMVVEVSPEDHGEDTTTSLGHSQALVFPPSTHEPPR